MCHIEEEPHGVVFVLDGGSLLQRVPRPKSTSYTGLCQLYAQFINSYFGSQTLDGYDSGPTTKDEIHKRRIGSEMGVDVDFTPDLLLTMKKKPFLANPRKITKVHLSLNGEGLQVKFSNVDADYDTAMTACDAAQTVPVVVVGDDTDLLVLLLHHFDPDSHNPIYLQTSSKTISIPVLQTSLDPTLSQLILFTRALSGCDTISRPYGIGKLSAIAKHQALAIHTDTFLTSDQSRDTIEGAGHQALAVLYGCQDLNHGWLSKFREKVITISFYVPPERLPPTIDAARFHSRRVYLQVPSWLGNDLEPTDWGWVLQDNILKPCRMEQAPAPASLLKVIQCCCTGSCARNTCSCRKHGLACKVAC